MDTEIAFLGEWTCMYQLFWCELQGYKVLTHCHIHSCGLISRELEVWVWLLTIVWWLAAATIQLALLFGNSISSAFNHMTTTSFFCAHLHSISCILCCFIFIRLLWLCLMLCIEWAYPKYSKIQHIPSCPVGPTLECFATNWGDSSTYTSLTGRKCGTGCLFKNGVTRRTPHDFDAKRDDRHDLQAMPAATVWTASGTHVMATMADWGIPRPWC